ncbi:hypothetical protein DFH09DRAFT_570365 [Mycena vulgaris]|nr:hypothetical protein DFH09DRAFT_570365 [Mycena vulgaris]
MPLINNSTGFHIHGGNFYEVSGDVNLETHQHLTMRQEQRLLHSGVEPLAESTLALEDGWADGSGCDSSGASSNPRLGMVGRAYDVSARARLLTRAAHPQDLPESSPSRLPIPSRREIPDLSDGESRSDGPLGRFQAEPPQSFHGGTFISAGNINHHCGEVGVQILHRIVALEALYDSAESFPQPRCHPETRTEMLDDLYSWAIADNLGHSIRWLHGPAGAGKSAVMQSLCERLQDAGRLGGSFFFKRGHTTRGNAKVLFATLAYQLALSHHRLNLLISRIVEGDPSVMARNMGVQLRKLIVEPCRSLNVGASPIFLIDGLDECAGHDVQQEILRLIGNVAHPRPLPLRLLIASRPEPHIQEKFYSFKGLYDSFKIDQSFTDVENYLCNEFNRIHREHYETMAATATPWPPSHVLRDLVANSSGYFIYAATIIKFIDDRDFRPTERLAAVVQNLPTECGSTPFHALDELYSQILRDLPFQSRIITILSVIVHGSSWPMMLPASHTNIEQLVGLDPGDLALALRRLHSLVLVPRGNTDSISLHHKSFRDFLLDPNRSGKFYLGLERRKELARSVLRVLSQSSACVPSTHVAWSIGSSGLDFITSAIPPSADLSSLLQTVNLNFAWKWSEDRKSPLERHVGAIITWLKKCSPLPENTIKIWEEYHFIICCDSTFKRPLASTPRALSDAACHAILSQFPKLLRVIQAWWILHGMSCGSLPVPCAHFANAK